MMHTISDSYGEWNGDQMTESIRPLVSVVVPVYNTKPDDLRSCFALSLIHISEPTRH